MKGLELAERYYHDVGAAMIAEDFGEMVRRLAVGLAGPGSECFGFDDTVSRDHDWGPGFCIWLTDEDYQSVGPALQAAYERLPAAFLGFGPRRSSPGEEGRVGVRRIRDFYGIYTGLDHPPSTLAQWLALPDAALATCTNGKVFHDPLGDFTHWREALLAFYPEDVRLKKITSCCLKAGQSGQYNFYRSLKRQDGFTARAALIQFCTEAMNLVFLLNRRYAPFYKWLHRAVRDLPVLGNWVYGQIDELIQAADTVDQTELIETISARIIDQLRHQGLSASASDFLLDHAHEVHGHIQDPVLRQHLGTL